MKQFLLTPPACLPQAQNCGLPLAHMAFHLSPEGRLHQALLPEEIFGGLMLVGVQTPPEPQCSLSGAVRDILDLCSVRKFSGVILDPECPPSPVLSRFIRLLDEGLARMNRGLFLPEIYGNYSRRAFLFLSSALSGGSLRQRLELAAARWGAQRLVLSLHRASRDFFLPAPDGLGRPITREELHRRICRLEPRIFFSPELCARYFTYMSRETGAHFVLFDDADSLLKKQTLAREVGIPRFFWLYPEIDDLLPELF